MEPRAIQHHLVYVRRHQQLHLEPLLDLSRLPLKADFVATGAVLRRQHRRMGHQHRYFARRSTNRSRHSSKIWTSLRQQKPRTKSATTRAKVFATGVVMFWNFFINRLWTYNDVQTMRIAIDYTAAARQGAGIGRYARELIHAVLAAQHDHRFVLMAATAGLGARWGQEQAAPRVTSHHRTP